MIGRWVENEERTVGLLSSAEYDEFSPLLITRTRRNIIRPVRKALGVSDARSDYESDTPASPAYVNPCSSYFIHAQANHLHASPNVEVHGHVNHVHINPNPEIIPPASPPDEIAYTYQGLEETSETKL